MTEIKRENDLVIQYKHKEEKKVTQIIHLLDELDYVASELDDIDKRWHVVLTQWINILLKNLKNRSLSVGY
ncbi:hypothetical protein [Pseudogracilibacillus sp. SO30301A]|uniref:hypothetical protein n=1 Tax=Pseudogracilibacillus sp. SO30301A TaxID=3098291 RepID=UPI00300E19CF